MANCLEVHNFLLSYEKASGQLINFEKSSLSFSPNTNEQLAENIKYVIAIRMVHAHEIYLGLPACVVRKYNSDIRWRE